MGLFEDLRAHAKSFPTPEGKRCCRALFTTVWVCVDHVNSSVMWIPRNLKLSTLSPVAPKNVDGGMLARPFPVVHDQLLSLADVEDTFGIAV